MGEDVIFSGFSVFAKFLVEVVRGVRAWVGVHGFHHVEGLCPEVPCGFLVEVAVQEVLIDGLVVLGVVGG